MAILNIDRHIVTDMVGINREIEMFSQVADRNWKKIKVYNGMMKAYCLDNNTNQCREVVDKKEKCIKKADEAWKKIQNKFSEQKALLLHIVNRIQEVDTGKGKEFTGKEGT